MSSPNGDVVQQLQAAELSKARAEADKTAEAVFKARQACRSAVSRQDEKRAAEKERAAEEYARKVGFDQRADDHYVRHCLPYSRKR